MMVAKVSKCKNFSIINGRKIQRLFCIIYLNSCQILRIGKLCGVMVLAIFDVVFVQFSSIVKHF